MRSLLAQPQTPNENDLGAPRAHVRRRRLRRRWIAVALVAIFVAGASGGAGLAFYSVKNQANTLEAQLTNHLQLGQAALESGKGNLKQANTTHDVKFVTSATADFKRAKVEFSTTRKLADGSKLLGEVEGLPVAGGQARSLHTALDHVADMGDAISDAGIELSALAGEVIVPQKSGQAAGKTLLNVLDVADKSIVTVRADLKRAEAAAAEIDLNVIPASQQATLTKARTSIGSGLAALDEFQQLVPVIREVFGANGPRNYLIEQVNPAELRPGGGFIGSFSVLRVDDGKMTLIRSGNSYDLVDPRPVVGQKGYVTPPGPFWPLLGQTSYSFIDSNFYPDFVTNATVAEQFVAPRLGMKIDAVVAIDYFTVAKLLELTGPLQIPGYRVTVTSSNFIPIVVQGDIDGDPAHKAILAATAGPLMERVSSLPSQQWPALISALNDLASSRHLQAYFNNSQVQSSMNAYGWSGALNPHGSSDFMAEIEANLGATKANYFVIRRYDVTLTRRGNVLHHQVMVTVTDNMPYTYRPNEFYKAYFRLILPANTSGARDDLTRLRWPDPSPPPGMQQLAGWIQIHGYGHSAWVTFSYDTPWTPDDRGRHEIYWQKQPGSSNDMVRITFVDTVGHSYATAAELSTDLLITMQPSGVVVNASRQASAKLPSLSLG